MRPTPRILGYLLPQSGNCSYIANPSFITVDVSNSQFIGSCVMRRLVSLCLFLALAGCQSTNSRPMPEANHAARYTARPRDGYVLVANGSGDSGTLSNNLISVVENTNLSLEVETFNWSHGRGLSFADHADRDNQQAQGKKLAAQVLEYSRVTGSTKVYLIGHSTGCAVMLIAAENLPPGSLEKIVLLAPSVPDTYDLRPAILATRGGIDSYHSRKDQYILGLGMFILGTTDPDSRTAAGLHGFRLIYSTPNDNAIYQNLRQHHWDPAVEWSGNNGGHNGCLTTGFLKAYVLPDMLK
jgi:pimeloyl-ACP methyl ester carboxylesterase